MKFILQTENETFSLETKDKATAARDLGIAEDLAATVEDLKAALEAVEQISAVTVEE